ncbi:MAG TPA: TrmH family RNA methyltransferase [Bacteroidales bacterium]|nr:TrmH family RNA methyltransferase [Bacteroidales bacterium]
MNRKLLNEELNRKTVYEYKQSEKNPIVIILDNVRSALNVGSVFRSCDAFLVDKIFLCGLTAVPNENKEIYKTALGATESVDWYYVDDTLEAITELKKKDFLIIGIEQVEHKILLQNFIPEKNKRYAFVFGHEIKGINQKVIDACDFCVEIPQWGYKHSLNIAVSAGIILWHTVLHLQNGIETKS